MADITAAMVKTLRDATNVSMMECKRALTETDGDMQAATRLLRERGIAVAAKRAQKEANQGRIASASSPDGRTLSLVEVNCETDFVARNDSFGEFVRLVAEKALETDEPLSEVMRDTLMDKIAAMGESIKIRRHIRFRLDTTGKLLSYIHLGGKVGVLLEAGCEKPETVANPVFEDLVKDLTLHTAAANPQYLTAGEIPQDVIAAEREIYAKQVENKPPQIVDKIVDGKIKKFQAEICFVDQPFVKEPKQSIRDLLAEKGKAVGDTLTIRRFARYQLGL